MIIYLDVLFVKEMIFNAIIIFLTGKITNQKMKITRVILSSLFGAIYSILIIVFNYALSENSFLKFVCALSMNWIAFKNIEVLIKSTMIFYLITFMIGGINLYTRNQGDNLYIALISLLVFIPSLVRHYKEKFKLDSYYGKIIMNPKCQPLRVLIDTGNSLTTCYNEAVLILSKKYQINKNVDMKKIRKISYRTINEKEICVEGIKVEKVVLEYRSEKYENEVVVINSNIEFEEYDAIIGLNFFEEARKIYKNEEENENGYFVIDKSKG